MVQTRFSSVQRYLVRYEAQNQERAQGSRADHQSFQLSTMVSARTSRTSFPSPPLINTTVPLSGSQFPSIIHPLAPTLRSFHYISPTSLLPPSCASRLNFQTKRSHNHPDRTGWCNSSRLRLRHEAVRAHSRIQRFTRRPRPSLPRPIAISRYQRCYSGDYEGMYSGIFYFRPNTQ